MANSSQLAHPERYSEVGFSVTESPSVNEYPVGVYSSSNYLVELTLSVALVLRRVRQTVG